MEEIDGNAMKCKEMISMKFEELMKELKERENELIQKVEEIKEQKKKEIYIQKDEMEMMLHGIKTTSQITQIMIENGTQIEIGKSQKQVMARLDTLNSFPYSFEPIHDSYFNFNSIKIDDIIQNINHFGEIIIKDPTIPVPFIIGGRLGLGFHRDYSKIAENQEPLVQFGSEGNEDGQFNVPMNLTTNSRGEIIVSDRDNHRIQIFNREGKFLRKFGNDGYGYGYGYGYKNNQLNRPRGVSIDQTNDQIVVADTESKFLIQKVIFSGNLVQREMEMVNLKVLFRWQSIRMEIILSLIKKIIESKILIQLINSF